MVPHNPQHAVRRIRSVWRLIGPFVGGSKWLLGLLGVSSMVAGLAEAGVLALVAESAAAMATGSEVVATDVGPLEIRGSVSSLLLTALGLAIVRLALQLLNAYLPARVTSEAQAALSNELFERFTRASWDVQSQQQEGHLQDLMTMHVSRATAALVHLANGMAAATTFITLVVSSLLISAPAAAAIVIAGFALFAGLRPLAKRARRHARENSSASLALAGGVSEAVRLAEEMQVYGTGRAHRARLAELIEAVRKPFFLTQLLGRAVTATYQSLAIIMIVAGLFALLVVGGQRIAALGAVVLMLVRAMSYGQQLQTTYQRLNELVPFMRRLRSEMDAFADSMPPDGPLPMPSEVDLRAVDLAFSYGTGPDVLRRISFSIRAGETVGIVGPSGAGKSTLVQILLRLREPTRGRYLVGGCNAQEISRSEWQNETAYVAQEPRLLDATVADNIRYFRDLDDAAVERAARLAHIHDDIMSWDGGYQRRIGQRVDAVSGGQRQRLSLARALAGNPRLLILDEPTSALDLRSEALVQESLDALKGRVTLVIVAHRVSTLSTCDRVMVLEGGRLQAFDEPAALQLSSEFFRDAVSLSGGEGPATTASPGP